MGDKTTVLDVGAGTGALVEAIRSAAPGARVIALDASQRLWDDAIAAAGVLALPPGRYGIIALNCPRETYTAKLSERRDIFLGLGDIYDKPIATFEVNAGEVVDIGHLELITGRSGAWGARSYKFAAVATPMAPAVLQKLAENYPDIYAARVTRLMTTPNNVQVRGQPASTPLR